jgi:putative transposase
MTGKHQRVGKEQDALLDALIAGCESREDILGQHGLFKELQKRLMERALEAELTHHLGYEPNEHSAGNNSRNGRSKKTVCTQSGAVEIEVSRDRHGEFEPQLVKKHQRRLEGFDEQVIALYTRGLSTQDIQSELEELYDIEVSPTLISNLTSRRC